MDLLSQLFLERLAIVFIVEANDPLHAPLDDGIVRLAVLCLRVDHSSLVETQQKFLEF